MITGKMLQREEQPYEVDTAAALVSEAGAANGIHGAANGIHGAASGA